LFEDPKGDLVTMSLDPTLSMGAESTPFASYGLVANL